MDMQSLYSDNTYEKRAVQPCNFACLIKVKQVCCTAYQPGQQQFLNGMLEMPKLLPV
jgi:hypothetical protein